MHQKQLGEDDEVEGFQMVSIQSTISSKSRVINFIFSLIFLGKKLNLLPKFAYSSYAKAKPLWGLLMNFQDYNTVLNECAMRNPATTTPSKKTKTMTTTSRCKIHLTHSHPHRTQTHLPVTVYDLSRTLRSDLYTLRS